jgi:ADP-heptose:LPS heptosyltransferase
MEEIRVRTFDSLGCTVLSTALFQSLKAKFPDSQIYAYSKFPQLLDGLDELDDVREPDSSVSYHVNLENYLSNRPHCSEPYRHLSVHMIELAERQLSENLEKEFRPKIKLTEEELSSAKKVVDNYRSEYGKPVVWLQVMSRSDNKSWPKQSELIGQFSSEYVFLGLSEECYTPRDSIALSKFCDAGIVVDSFLLHGSEVAGTKNVIVLLGSSNPKVVTYPGQTVIYERVCEVQPCGMHKGYVFPGKDYGIFNGHEDTYCITDDFRCMRSISVDDVNGVLRKLLRK